MSTSDVRSNCVRLYSSTASAVYVMPIPVRVRAAQVTTKQTPTRNGPEVTDTDPGQSKTIPVQNTKQLYHQLLNGELSLNISFTKIPLDTNEDEAKLFRRKKTQYIK